LVLLSLLPALLLLLLLQIRLTSAGMALAARLYRHAVESGKMQPHPQVGAGALALFDVVFVASSAKQRRLSCEHLVSAVPLRACCWVL
jgi:hypothetical protein